MKHILSSLFLLAATLGHSQNLVLNPSFELGAVCDGTTESIDQVADWQGLSGSPRFINTNCPLSRDARTYVQGMKLPPANHGDVLAGIGIAQKGEYLGGKLTQTLEAGKQYVVKVSVRLPIKFCNAPIHEIGILLHGEAIKPVEELRMIDRPALSLQNNTQSEITTQYRWEELSALYTATGDEQFITIGNFANNNTERLADRTEKECTYLFLDRVVVEEFQAIDVPTFSSDIALKKANNYVLADVQFEKGNKALQEKSTAALQQVVDLLVANPTLKIEVSCHVDNTREASASQILTEARAKEVLNKLVALGASATQISTVGKGDAAPISLNNTEKGRLKNNRLELLIVDL